jgi:hypothetical protein
MPKYKFPIEDEGTLLRSKLVLSVFKITPPVFDQREMLSSEPKLTDPRPDAIRFAGNRALAQKNSEIELAPLQVSDTGEQIELFIPQVHNVNDIFNYDTATTLNPSGATALAGINAGSGALAALGQGLIEGGRSFTDLFTDEGIARTGGRMAAARLANSFLGNFVPQGVKNVVGLAARVTVNPNLATTFNGVGIRQFVFQFKFFPKSAKESEQIKKIIKVLRLNAYPDEVLIGSIPVGFEYPNMFRIRLLSGGTNKLYENVGTPIKMAYLQNIQHAYNPTASTFHEDGSPTEIDLSLTFFEYRALNRSDVEAEDTDRFYEYYGKAAETEFESVVKRDGQGRISGL